MARDLNAATALAVQAETLAPIALVSLGFDSGVLRLWSGIGELEWDGEVWHGAGSLGSISAIEETAEIRAVGVVMELSGIPVDAEVEDGRTILEVANDESWQGRPAEIYYAVLSGRSFVGTPVQLFGGMMDRMTLVEGSMATIRVACESKQIDLERAKVRRYTAEDQRSEFPGDRGADTVAALQDIELRWGRE